MPVTPGRDRCQFTFVLPEIVEVWRCGSVISSWLLDLAANALQDDPALAQFEGRVSDSGEGRWTIMAAIDEAAPVLSAALHARFNSLGEANFANNVLSAMRREFGGHSEKTGKVMERQEIQSHVGRRRLSRPNLKTLLTSLPK